MNKIALFGVAALTFSTLAFPAFAAEVYAGGGTQGLVLGLGKNISNTTMVRGEFNVLNYRDNYSSDNVNYNATLKYLNAGVFLDVHPFANAFRLTAGALVGSDKLNGSAQATNGTININGNTYSSTGQSMTASLSFPTVRPYLGLGIGHTVTKGLSFFADVGVAYGKPTVNISASPALAQAAAADITAEQQSLDSKANKLKFMPVVSMGLSYSF